MCQIELLVEAYLMAERELVVIDETWTKTNMTALRVWAPCGISPAATSCRYRSG
jgi:hypothetical protein